MLHTQLVLPHLLALDLSHCICWQPLDLMGIHLLHCTHGEKRMGYDDVMWDSFVFITKDATFFVLHEETHILLPFHLSLCINWLTLWFSWMVSKHWLTSSSLEYIWFCGQLYFVKLLWQSWFMLNIIFYYNQYLANMFLPLTTKVFWHLHQWIDDFLPCNVNMEWIMKGMDVFFFWFCIHFIGKGWWRCNKRKWCLFQGMLLLMWMMFF